MYIIILAMTLGLAITMINVVKVQALSSDQLVDDTYRINEMFSVIKRHYESGGKVEYGCEDLYFFNKIPWLQKRLTEIYLELQQRGLKPSNLMLAECRSLGQEASNLQALKEFHVMDLDYTPSDDDIKANAEHIYKRWNK